MRVPRVVLVLGAFLLSSCGPSDEDLRRIVREEMQKGAEPRAITPVSVIGPYSPAVRVGRFLFVSGQIALDQETGQLRNDNIEVETRQVLDNMSRILRAAGYDSSNVINATVYLKNINDYQKMNAVYGGYFNEERYPARVAVEVSNLPRQANVEIAVIAFR